MVRRLPRFDEGGQVSDPEIIPDPAKPWNQYPITDPGFLIRPAGSPEPLGGEALDADAGPRGSATDQGFYAEAGGTWEYVWPVPGAPGLDGAGYWLNRGTGERRRGKPPTYARGGQVGTPPPGQRRRGQASGRGVGRDATAAVAKSVQTAAAQVKAAAGAVKEAAGAARQAAVAARSAARAVNTAAPTPAKAKQKPAGPARTKTKAQQAKAPAGRTAPAPAARPAARAVPNARPSRAASSRPGAPARPAARPPVRRGGSGGRRAG